jgi:hypothetical protein
MIATENRSNYFMGSELLFGVQLEQRLRLEENFHPLG